MMAMELAGLQDEPLDSWRDALPISVTRFTEPARDLARQQRIELMDERDVARRFQSAGGWWDPLFRSAFVSPPKLCPKCGSPLVERVAKRGPGVGQAFYGCSRYPRCKHTMPG